MPDRPAAPVGEIVLYQTEDGRTRVEYRFPDETLWLNQALIAELFQKDVRTINEHLQNVFEEGDLDPGRTIRKFRIVRREGAREVAREIEHCNLDAILAVGYRVRSERGTQFRRWATERLREYWEFRVSSMQRSESMDEKLHLNLFSWDRVKVGEGVRALAGQDERGKGHIRQDLSVDTVRGEPGRDRG